jgi:carbon starvation protein
MALVSVAVLTRTEYFAALGKQGPGAVMAFASGLAQFATSFGLPAETGQTFAALAISAFILTTLDTATRLARFAWQELFSSRAGAVERDIPVHIAVLRNRFIATIAVVACAAYLVFSGGGMQIWPVFGASNQLLAALTLLVITLILVRRRENFWISLVPMGFMGVLSAWALAQLLKANTGKNMAIAAAALFLLLMAGILGVLSVVSLLNARKGEAFKG